MNHLREGPMDRKKLHVIARGMIFRDSDPLIDDLGRAFLIPLCECEAELFKRVQHERIDGILLEIDSHGKELEIVKRLHEQCPRIPVIALGTNLPREIVAQAFRYGARDYFREPCKSGLLIERVEAMAQLME